MNSINEYGHFEITLDKLLKEKKKSKNYLAEHANLQRTQLNTYCKGNIKRPDFDVLARICYVLDCDISDIVRYIPPPEKVEKKSMEKDKEIMKKEVILAK